MIYKAIAATTEVDRHNCRITKEALYSSMKAITEGEYVPSVGLNHDHTVMPIGKNIKGELIPFKNSEYAAQIYQDIFFDEFFKEISDTGDVYYIGKSQYDNRPFVDTKAEDIFKMRISIDPINFSHEDYHFLKDYFENYCNADSQTTMRKSLIPDPEIVFTLIPGTLLFWAGKKAVDKLSDLVASDIANCYSCIKMAIVKTFHYFIPKSRPITYVFREYNPYTIELIIQTPNLDEILEVTNPILISQVFDKIEQISALASGDIAKVQFLYDFHSKKWEFNYLTTGTGKVLGTEKCYKRTAKVFESVINHSKSQIPISQTTIEHGEHNHE